MKNHIIIITKNKTRARVNKIIEILDNNNVNYELKTHTKSDKLSFNKFISYGHWLLVLLIFFLKRGYKPTYYVIGFEGALLLSVFSKLFNYRFVYDNADNLAISVANNKFLRQAITSLEENIIKNTILHIVPHTVRLDYYKKKGNYFILPNYPTKKSFDQAFEKSKEIQIKNQFVIYINGWLVDTRGRKMILDFIKKLPSQLNLIIYVATPKNEVEFDYSEYVIYLGKLNYTDALSYYFKSHLVFTFYDPKVEINTVATPNKWGDAILTETVPVINNGIKTSDYFFPKGGHIKIEYNSVDELLNTFLTHYKQIEMVNEKKEILSMYSNKYFDTYFKQILEKILL